MLKTKRIALIAVFAALHTVLYLPEGPWRSFVIYLIPIEGIVLGPIVGFSSALLGSTIARLIKFDPFFWMFGVVAEPIGVAAAGFLAKGRWKETVGIYSAMLIAYFAHPFGRMLPLWTVLDLLLAIVLIYPASKIGKWVWGAKTNRLSASLLIIAFVSTVADSMTRVFLLVPAGLYNQFGWSYDFLANVWFIPGAIGSYFEDIFVCVATFIAGIPLLVSLRRVLHLEEPLS